ncbi:MAG: hypothetical protein FWE88_05040 [Phycisphaerae bacterium]|nr:hypothetical protein [Phycisphaerae bacterium]
MSDNRSNDPAFAPRRRRRVTGRIAMGFLILFLLCLVTAVATFFWWTRDTQSRLQAEIDAIHARGEPVTLAEITYFRQGQLLPEQNAFTLYQQASDSLEALPDDVLLLAPGFDEASVRSSLELLNDYPDWRREHTDKATAFLIACQPALDLIRQARGMDGVPTIGPKAPDKSAPPELDDPNLSGARQLAKLSLLAATMAHEAGDDNEAFEHLRDILQIRDLVGEHPTTIPSLVQVSITALAAKCLEHITPTLKIGDGPGEVDLADVRELAERLIQSERLLEVARKAMISERVRAYELMHSDIIQDNLRHASFLAESVTSNIIDANLAVSLRYWSIKSAKLRTANRYNPDHAVTPEDRQWLEEFFSDDWGRVKEAIYIAVSLLCPSFDRYDLVVYRGLASQRMAGLALLMRAYEVETGQPVATLDDLVPRYLTALPEDPFSPTGQPPRYIPDGPHPRLYCLNDNQQDDGGDFGETIPSKSWNPKDWPFFLNDTRHLVQERDELPKER